MLFSLKLTITCIHEQSECDIRVHDGFFHFTSFCAMQQILAWLLSYIFSIRAIKNISFVAMISITAATTVSRRLTSQASTPAPRLASTAIISSTIAHTRCEMTLSTDSDCRLRVRVVHLRLLFHCNSTRYAHLFFKYRGNSMPPRKIIIRYWKSTDENDW